MRRLLLSLAFLLTSAQACAGAWTDLWLTPDQQAQRLMDAGQAGKAAKQFQDPRLRAYADMKAGDYDSAAQQLAPLKDAESLYNRGNALARAGKLKDALAAYDAALARAPAHRDARHNRDLIAQQLQKQNDGQPNGQQGKGQQGKDAQQGNGGQQGGNGSPRDQQGSNERQAGQQGSSGQQAQPQSGSQRNGSQQNNGQQQSAGEQGSQNAQNAGQSQQSNQGQGGEARGAGEQNGQQSAGGKQNGALAQNDSGQAAQNGGANNNGERDVAAAGQQSDQQKADAARRDAQAAFQRGGVPQGRVAGAEENRKPTSEQALAREQWLRQIPEDPGELLRRKFMVEHMKKQQDSGQ